MHSHASSPDLAPVLIVMAVFRPDPAHLAAQLGSIAAQTHSPLRVIAVIADQVSGDLVARLAEDAGLTDTVLVPCDNDLDAVRAFEAGLWEAKRLAETMTPEPLIALSDQDDIWHPDRLARGVADLARTGAQLVHSDARLVGPDGTTVQQPSMFAFERRHRNPGLRGLLYRNNITGMTVLMRPQVMHLALPFPPQSGVHFYHDLWLGLIAAATGGVALIDAPLVDYRQHGQNAIGAVDRQKGWLRGKRKDGKSRLPDSMWLRHEAAAYALARYLAQSLNTRLIDAVQDGTLPHGGAQIAPMRAYLRRLRGVGTHLLDTLRLALTGHLGLARIAAGFGVVSFGRPVWALREALGPGLSSAINSFDTRLYSLSPGATPKVPRNQSDIPRKPVAHDTLTDVRKTPRWQPDFTAPRPALNVLVPTLNPTEVFAGIVTALDIGIGLAARGHEVRFIATDLPVSSPAASRNFLLRRLSAEVAATGAAERITLACGVKSGSVAAHKDDVFLATAWWSAHVADQLIAQHGFANHRFFYLIQDYEPNFYAWGPEYADAMASYDLAFDPLFNTTTLRDYFAEQGFAFATPDALAFHPAIDIARYAAGPRADRVPGNPRRLALYGRPEVARNMYATAIESLAQFVAAENLGPQDIELVSLGLAHAPVALPNGLVLNSLGKLSWDDYPGYLLGTDLGLSLMYSPHPSHPPIEMAASGVRVVTNSFGSKDLSRLSPAILSSPATPPLLAATLSRAWAMPEVSAAERRIDLADLGQPLETLMDTLALRLAPRLSGAAA